MKKNKKLSEWFALPSNPNKKEAPKWTNGIDPNGLSETELLTISYPGNYEYIQYPNWYYSTKRLTPEEKQQHFNRIYTDFYENEIDASILPELLKGMAGYGEDSRNRTDFYPHFGFEAKDVDYLLENARLGEFKSGGEFADGGKYSSPETYSTYEQKYNLPKGLLYNVARTESNFNPNAVSKAGARGLMQLMPMTAQEFGIDSTNPEQSIDAAGKYISQLIKQTGNVEDALRAYNWGIGNVQKWKKGQKQMPLETQQYVGKVLGKSTPSIGGGIGKYFNQIEQDLAWKSKEIEKELEDEKTLKKSSKDLAEVETEEDDEYVSEEDARELMKQERRNVFIDLVMQSMPQSIDDTWQGKLFS